MDEEKIRMLAKIAMESLDAIAKLASSSEESKAIATKAIDKIAKIDESFVEILPDKNQAELNKRLMSAVTRGSVTAVNKLLEQGADINVEDSYGTLLHRATKYGHYRCLDYLIGKNVLDLNAENSFQDTPVIIAARYGYLDCLEVLHEHGASSKGSKTSVMYEAVMQFKQDNNLLVNGFTSKYFQCLKYLVEQNHNIDELGYHGCTALLATARHGLFDLAKYLVENGANIHALDNDGNSALQLSVNHASKDVFKYFFGLGVDPLNINNEGDSLVDMLNTNSKDQEFLSIIDAVKEQKHLNGAISSDGKAPSLEF